MEKTFWYFEIIYPTFVGPVSVIFVSGIKVRDAKRLEGVQRTTKMVTELRRLSLRRFVQKI